LLVKRFAFYVSGVIEDWLEQSHEYGVYYIDLASSSGASSGG
jgi:hypothetical protein